MTPKKYLKKKIILNFHDPHGRQLITNIARTWIQTTTEAALTYTLN